MGVQINQESFVKTKKYGCVIEIREGKITPKFFYKKRLKNITIG